MTTAPAMNISLEKQPNCLATLKVEVPADLANKERDTVMKSFMRETRIPGFRPGKAPKAVIQKRHGEAISQEVEGRLIQMAIQEALKQNEDLKIIDVKTPENVTHAADGTFSFDAVMVLAPEFTLPEYKGLEIEIPKAEITDEIVDQNLDQLRQRFADYEDVEGRAIEDNDLVVIDYTSTIDGKPLDEVAGEQAKTLAQNEGYWIRIEDEGFFPGFTDALKGSKPGDDKEITVTLPNDFPIAELREKEALFQVQVKEIKKEVLPELNDEFASKLDEGKTLEEIKNLIHDDLDLRQKRQLEEFKINSVLSALADKVDFELPEELLKSETQGQADTMVQEAAQGGISDEEMEEKQAEIFEAAGARAKNSLKTNFLLQEIAEAEKLEVSSQDLMQRITVMAKQAKQPVKKCIKELQKNGQINNVRQNMLLGKAVDFLVEHANVTEVEPKEEADTNE